MGNQINFCTKERISNGKSKTAKGDNITDNMIPFKVDFFDAECINVELESIQMEFDFEKEVEQVPVSNIAQQLIEYQDESSDEEVILFVDEDTKGQIINPVTELDLYNGCSELAKTIEKNISDKMQSYCKGFVSKQILSYKDDYVVFGLFLMENFNYHVVNQYYHILRRINANSVNVLRKINELKLLGGKIDLTVLKCCISKVTAEWGCLFQFCMSIDLQNQIYFKIFKKDFEDTIKNIKTIIEIEDDKVSPFEFTWKLRVEQVKNRCYLPAKIFHEKKVAEDREYYGKGALRWIHKKPQILRSRLCDQPELPKHKAIECLQLSTNMNMALTNKVSELLLTS